MTTHTLPEELKDDQYTKWQEGYRRLQAISFVEQEPDGTTWTVPPPRDDDPYDTDTLWEGGLGRSVPRERGRCASEDIG